MDSLLYKKESVFSDEVCNQFIQKYKANSKRGHDAKYTYTGSDSNYLNVLRYEINQYILQCFYRVSKDVGNKDILTDYYFIEKIAANSSMEYEPPVISRKSNCISFILYLNTVDQAYDTFIDSIQIPAIQGQLVIFPCDLTFPYKHGSSTAEDKYILKGTIFFHNT